MGALLSYSLTASVIIMVLYPVLQLTVNRSTSFRFNRIIMLCGIALSLALPCAFNSGFMHFTYDMPAVSSDISANIDAHISGIAEGQPHAMTPAIPWLPVVLIVYLSGIIVLACREIITFFRLFRMIAKSEKIDKDNHTICRIEDNRTAPFSWGRYIFLRDSESDSANCIYIHEKAHTYRRHWIDVLIADLFCIVLWYNPFAWMTRQLMKLNHEFEADEAVISSGIETYDYQRLLVVKAMGNRSIPIANSFAADKRSFRKRVLIMSKKRASKKTMLIALCAIPAVALAGTALTMPVASHFLSDISDYSLREELLSEEKQPDQAPQDPITETEPSNPETETPTVIPSPFEDQKPLAEIIRFSVENIRPDKDTKVNINIVVDEDGRVKDVSADTPDGAEVAAAISRNFNGVRLEQIIDNGQPIEVHFVVPVHLKKKE